MLAPKEKPMAEAGLTFEVRKSDWSQTRFVEGPVPELARSPVSRPRP